MLHRKLYGILLDIVCAASERNPTGEETARVLREAIARAPATLDALPISPKERTYMKTYVQSLQAAVDRCDRIAPQHQRMKSRSGAATKKSRRK